MSPSDRPVAWEDDFSRNNSDFGLFPPQIDVASLSLDRLRRQLGRVSPPSIQEAIELAAALAADPYPIPRDDEREGYAVGQPEWYWLSGLIDWLKIRLALEKYDVRANRVMEMGAATGRVLRHIWSQGRFAEVWGSDLNYRHVRWINEFLDPSIRCFHNHALPHLPIADSRLDLFCAFSVFTHIDTFETAWIAETFRVLRPGGMAYVTFQTEHTWDELKRLDPDDRRLAVLRKTTWFRNEMIQGPLPGERIVARHSLVGPYRGMVFHDTAHIRKNWGRYFEILELIPMYHGMDQTVAIMRRRAEA